MSDIDQLYPRALAAYKAGEHAAAERDLDALLAQRPQDARALLLKGVAHAKDDGPVSLALVEQSVALDPQNAEAWYNLGVYEAERGRLDAALAAYERTVQLQPLHDGALGNGCELLRRFDRFEDALGWADRVMALGRGGWAAHLNRAVCLFHLRRWDEAEAEYLAARRLAPDRPIVQWEAFPLYLHQESFAPAWEAFERRFDCGDLNGVHCYPFPQPQWRGEPLAGRHMLIHNEQGLGDQIMFACALQEVVDAAAEVTLVAAPELAALFRASYPTVRVFPARFGRFAGDHPPPDWLPELGPVDYQLPIGGLMHRLRTTRESFGTPRAYLRPSDAARARWAARPRGEHLAVGVCWASNPALFRHDSSRRAVKKSLQLETLAPLADVPGADLVSVLNWRIDPTPAAFEGRLEDVSAQLTSLDDTAALIETLDLVITVDTAVAHLAGALGKPTWLLLHDFADCRWGLTAERSYWYPDMRLFRQRETGAWGPVVSEVAAELAALAGRGR
jgi:hypothetical protein